MKIKSFSVRMFVIETKTANNKTNVQHHIWHGELKKKGKAKIKEKIILRVCFKNSIELEC